jgi:hypothetical protein
MIYPMSRYDAMISAFGVIVWLKVIQKVLLCFIFASMTKDEVLIEDDIPKN